MEPAESLQQEVRDLRVRLAARDAELSRWRQQYMIVDSLWTSLERSWSWKLLAPLRSLRRWFAPRGFDHRALIPWQQLQQLDVHAWRAHGPDPQFCVPCLLPRGWFRLQMRMTSSVPGRIEFLADYGDGFHPSESLGRWECPTILNIDRVLYLSRPARGVRFKPIDAPAELRLELLRLEPLYLPIALAKSCARCWHALRTQLPALFGGDLPTQSTAPTPKDDTIATLGEQPLVSIVIACPGRPARVAGTREYRLSRCIETIRRLTTYWNYEIVVVHDNGIPEDLARDLARSDVHDVAAEEPFNWATASNLGAARARGELLVFVHEDVEVVTADWLEAMLQHATATEIGAVGPAIGDTHHNEGRTLLSGACLMTRSDLFDALNGFTDDLGLSYAAADYCLKARRLGKKVVIEANAKVMKSQSRLGAYPAELQLFRARWPQHAWDARDNPNLGEVCYDHRC